MFTCCCSAFFTLGSVLLTGIVLTLVCAFFSVNRHLYMSREEANLY